MQLLSLKNLRPTSSGRACRLGSTAALPSHSTDGATLLQRSLVCIQRNARNGRNARIDTASNPCVCVATGVRGGGPHRAALASGGKWAKNAENVKKNSRENSDCIISFMCLRARKTKHYGQRVPIVSYHVVTADIT